MEPYLQCNPWRRTVNLKGKNSFQEAVKLGDYLKSQTSPGPRIAVLGSEREIYFYADRHSATGYIYTYGLMEPQRYALEMLQEMIADIEAAKPESVVFVNVPLSFGRVSTSKTLILKWADVYLRNHYEKVATVDMNGPTEYICPNLIGHACARLRVCSKEKRVSE